jgi:hypothetical protein
MFYRISKLILQNTTMPAQRTIVSAHNFSGIEPNELDKRNRPKAHHRSTVA